ncbi:MAG: 6-phosphogluconolactonase, partial [Treponema sp.]|jgi:6-phosphogluconolactonase/glucosamine-6-phosphate isomerase/deaminase|nr:6-phosphogluconolactonase [Treponema sp.]
LAFTPDRIRLFDGRAGDLEAECQSVERFIARRGGIDFMLLGVGMNGHLALNEPGCDPHAGARVTEIAETTRQVGQKYFSGPQTLTCGLTLGIKNISAAGAIVVSVIGAHKAPVVKRLRESPAGDAAFPASLLKGLPQVCFYFDRAAAGSGA